MVLLGFIFGFVMQKGQVFAPYVIRDQFLFTRFIMLKMFLSALASSLVVQSLMCYFDNSKFEKSRECYCKKSGILRIIIGGVLLGIGMVFAGSCPGNIFVQIGSMVENVQ